MLSIRNWVRIVLACAPTALRKPISRVRSVTDTSMMFITPMPPTSSEIPAMALRNSVTKLSVDESESSTDAALLTLKSAALELVIRCAANR